MSAVVTHQARYELLAFWRDPQRRLLTLGLPIVLLVALASLVGDGHVEVDGHSVPRGSYYAAQLAAVAVISAAFTSPVVSLAAERESGILKRRRATPARQTGLVGGRVVGAAVVAVGAVACLLLVAWIAYDVEPAPARLPAVLLATVAGAAAFACLGYALASFIRSPDSANAVVQCILLPLYVISGVLVPSDELPSGLLRVADLFPVRHLALALYAPLAPTATGSAIQGIDLLVIALWGLAGFVVARRHFAWAPRRAP
jgi:ABC-2 type transport system permease protein